MSNDLTKDFKVSRFWSTLHSKVCKELTDLLLSWANTGMGGLVQLRLHCAHRSCGSGRFLQLSLDVSEPWHSTAPDKMLAAPVRLRELLKTDKEFHRLASQQQEVRALTAACLHFENVNPQCTPLLRTFALLSTFRERGALRTVGGGTLSHSSNF